AFLLSWRAAGDVPVAQWSVARPERFLSVQCAHGAASDARARDRAADDHGDAGLDAASAAREAWRRTRGSMADKAHPLLRDLQRGCRGLASAADGQLRARAPSGAHRAASHVPRGVGDHVVAGPKPVARAAAAQLSGTDAVPVLAEHPDGD